VHTYHAHPVNAGFRPADLELKTGYEEDEGPSHNYYAWSWSPDHGGPLASLRKAELYQKKPGPTPTPARMWRWVGTRHPFTSYQTRPEHLDVATRHFETIRTRVLSIEHTMRMMQNYDHYQTQVLKYCVERPAGW
jgi:hypothetical protein